ncbi:Flp family type IVb pilin [Thalassovita aquimarina]|uniref:Pilus assembly protein n=1 Tax=Thalassovita aquimarina TaxID=2785917 RepID=A0ABS5HVM4_9RHOB|nr:pilus assembly protein [Thalassovita aquimarina]MBR9653031.1 pilus assembly protein [Thalassovita aquimarina]
MIKFIKNFRKDEDGAVTVDWVVLTAAVVGLGIAAVTTVSGGINTAATTLTNDLSTDMTTATTTN